MKVDAARAGCSKRARSNTNAVEDHNILNRNLKLFVQGGIDAHVQGVEPRVQATRMTVETLHFEATDWAVATAAPGWFGYMSQLMLLGI